MAIATGRRSDRGRVTPKAKRLTIPEPLWERWVGAQLDPALLAREPLLDQVTRAVVDGAADYACHCDEGGDWGRQGRRMLHLGASGAVGVLGPLPAMPAGIDAASAIADLGRYVGHWLTITADTLRFVQVADASGAWFYGVEAMVEDAAIRLCGHDGEDREALLGPDGLLCDGCVEYAGSLWGAADAGTTAVLFAHAALRSAGDELREAKRTAALTAQAQALEAARRAKRAEQRRARRQGAPPAPSTPRPLVDPEAAERARAEAAARAEANRQRLAEAFAAALEPGADRAEALRHYRQVAVEVGDVDGAAWAKQELRTLRTQGTDTEAQTTGPDVGRYPKGS